MFSRTEFRPARYVVIGGAVMGASAAYWLTRMSPGLKVLVVEKQPQFGGTTARSTRTSARTTRPRWKPPPLR